MQATISHSTDLINGGCNACPTIKTMSYTLTLGQVTTPLEELDVPSLVMAIVLQAGFRQTLVMDFMDECIEFQYEEKRVRFVEQFGKQIYKTDEQEIISTQHQSTELLFQQVNQILTELFEIEAVAFIVV